MFRWIASHPLVCGGLVRDVTTGDRVDIKVWRLRDGLIERTGALYCSIVPFFGDKPGPISTTATTRFEKLDVSRAGIDHANMLFNIKLDIAVLPFKTLDVQFEVENPTRTRGLEIMPDMVSYSLAVHPGHHIIGEYLEIIRLALTDPRIELQVPFLQVRPPRPLNLNLRADPWEKDTNVIWHSGSLLVSVDAFIDRSWITSFRQHSPDIQVSLDFGDAHN